MPHALLPLPLPVAEQLDTACDRFEDAWRAGESPRIEDFLETSEEPQRSVLLRLLLELELELLCELGDPPSPEGYRRRFATDAALIEAVFQEAPRRTRENLVKDVSADPVPSRAPNVEPGPLRLGRYEIAETIGSGAFGTVYRAYDPQLDRQVALKVARPGLFRSQAEWEQFLREARAAAALMHPNLCPVYEIGQADGRHFLVMAYIEGEVLSRALHECEGFSAVKAVTLTQTLAWALEEAHRRGIVHRDLKPANILLNRRGEPIVVDFGLAHRVEGEAAEIKGCARIPLTGTPAYMSPERVRGEPAGNGPTGDIYSLGVILYELLARRRPFQGSAAEVLQQVAHTSPPPLTELLPELDPTLESICRKAMSRTMAERYQSMGEFATALGEWLAQRQMDRSAEETASSSTATVVGHVEVAAGQPRTRSDSSPLAVWIIGGMLLCATLALTAWLSREANEISAPSSDPQRQAARQLLGLYARLEIRAGDGAQAIHDAQESPGADFQIVSVDFEDNTLVRDSDLSALRRLPALSVLKLSRTEITDPALEHLRGAENLTVLELDETQISDEGLAHLSGLRRLTRLSLNGTLVSDEGLGRLRQMNHLADLALDDTDVTDRGLANLGAISSLNRLSLRRLPITSAGLEHLRGLSNLTSLALDDTEITDQGLESLSEVRELRELDLSGTKIAGPGLDHLHGLRHLTRLSLARTKISSEDLWRLNPLQSLTHLSCDYTDVTGKFLRPITELTNLRSLSLSGTKMGRDGVARLKALPRLSELWLNDIPLTDAAIPSLAELKVKRLHVSRTSLSPEGLARLQAAMPQCEVVR